MRVLFEMRRASKVAITAFALLCGSCLSGPAWAATYSSLVMSKNPVAYWRLGEASGPTAIEEVGTGGGINNGTYLNVAGGSFAQPGLITGDANTAVRFNGSNSYVNAGSDASMEGAWSGITAMAWINADALPASGIAVAVSQWVNNAAQDRFLLSIDSGGRVLAAVGNGVSGINGAAGTATVTPGQRHFVAFTFQNGLPGTYSLFLDGALDTISNSPTAVNSLNPSTTTNLHIGAQVVGVARYFSGLIDEVALFNTALSPAEIQEFYLLGLNGPPPPAPEPSSMVLLGLGVLGLVRRNRRGLRV